MDSFSEVFEDVKKHCLADPNVSQIGYDKWIKPLEADRLENRTAYILAQSEFAKQTVMDFYYDLIKKSFLEVLGIDVEVSISNKSETMDDSQQFNYLIENEKHLERSLNDGLYDLTFDNFIKGKSNELAYAFCTAVAGMNEDSGNIGNKAVFNPLFIYGDSGLGKTHLLKAIEHEVKKRNPEKNVMYVTCETFANELIKAITNRDTESFHQKYRNVDFLLMDDIQFLSKKEQTQEEFFHTFNELYNHGKQIVLTSDISPTKISKLEDRIKSRFVRGVQADIQPPDFETRMAIIKRKAELLNIEIPDPVSRLIAEKIKTNIRQLEGAVNKITALTMFSNEKPSIAMAQKVIRENLIENQPADITVDRILADVSTAFNVTPDDIRSPSRNAPISLARKISIYVIREVKGLSYTEIGDELKRDHSTMTINYKDVKKMLDSNADLKETVNDIIKNLREV